MKQKKLDRWEITLRLIAGAEIYYSRHRAWLKIYNKGDIEISKTEFDFLINHNIVIVCEPTDNGILYTVNSKTFFGEKKVYKEELRVFVMLLWKEKPDFLDVSESSLFQTNLIRNKFNRWIGERESYLENIYKLCEN